MKLPIIAALALALIACTPAEPIATAEQGITVPGIPEPGYITRLLPLTWQPTDDWTLADPLGAIHRKRPCGLDEPFLSTLVIDIDEGTLPHGATLVGGSVRIDPCDAPRSAYLPDNRLTISFDIVDFHGSPVVSSGGVQDQSLDIASYLKPHEIDLKTTDLPPIDRTTQRMLFRLENEYGQDAAAGLRVSGLKVFFK